MILFEGYLQLVLLAGRDRKESSFLTSDKRANEIHHHCGPTM
jgi:hypothetical protein